ncbi:TonB-dependent receptor [Roseimarinus sediminis]|uniref:TonB-dependent receptor n=1 Tax=Roseimarinus sediminis TaxID=1610899 RepID=UPI003D1F1012
MGNSILHIKWNLVFCLLLVNFFSWAQNKVHINGLIADAVTGEVLINASIYNKTSKTACLSNAFGYYNLSVEKGVPVEIVISYMGYSEQQVFSSFKSDTSINFHLSPDNHQLEEVKVHANKVNNRELGIMRMTNTQINSVPALGGEGDVLKAYQSMPGIAVGAEGRSDIYVRGGGHDQNLFILDDIPLYYINHLGGFVSVFNSDVIKDSKIIKGGFPAKYGNRLSSVIDIRMKDGNSKSFHGSASIGLISSKIALEGPIKDGSTTFMISARRLMWDVFVMKPLSAILNSGDLITGYTFYDINAKVKHKLSDKDYLYFSFYNGDDITSNIFNIDETSKQLTQQKWGNFLTALRHNRIYSKKLFSNSTISYTKFRYLSDSRYSDSSEETEHSYQSSLSSSINDLMVKTNFEYFKNNHYKLDFGGGFTIHNFQPGKQTVEEISEASKIDTTLNQSILHSYERFLYFENQIKLGSKINMNLGLRATNYSIQQKSFNSLEPRFIFDYSFT